MASFNCGLLVDLHVGQFDLTTQRRAFTAPLAALAYAERQILHPPLVGDRAAVDQLLARLDAVGIGRLAALAAEQPLLTVAEHPAMADHLGFGQTERIVAVEQIGRKHRLEVAGGGPLVGLHRETYGNLLAVALNPLLGELNPVLAPGKQGKEHPCRTDGILERLHHLIM